jgi:hypothetical protein
MGPEVEDEACAYRAPQRRQVAANWVEVPLRLLCGRALRKNAVQQIAPG